MSSSVHHPHDSLVKAVLSDPQEAAEFVRPHMPESLRDLIDWQTLRLVNATHVDEELAGREGVCCVP